MTSANCTLDPKGGDKTKQERKEKKKSQRQARHAFVRRLLKKALDRGKQWMPSDARVKWTALMRAAAAMLPLILWLSDTNARSGAASQLVIGAGVVLLLAAVTPFIARFSWSSKVLIALIAIDGIWLVVAFHNLGTLRGPMAPVLALDIVATTLLTSYRTGIELAAWVSALVVAVVAGSSSGLIGNPVPYSKGSLAAYVLILFVTALGVGMFASAHEHELMKRRQDAEAFTAFMATIGETYKAEDVAEHLARFGRDEIGARRCIVIVQPEAGERGGRPMALISGEKSTEILHETVPLPPLSVVRQALTRRTPVLRKATDPDADNWIETKMPGARNLVVVASRLSSGPVAAVIFELAGTARSATRRPRMERRAVVLAETAVRHTCLAFERSILLASLRSEQTDDRLPGFANRKSFDASLSDQVLAAQSSGRPFSIVLIGIDQVVEEGLAPCETELMLDAARTIRKVVRGTDLICQYSSSSLAILMPGALLQGAEIATERFRRAVENGTFSEPIAACMGAAAFPDHGEASHLLAAAEDALARARVAAIRHTAANKQQNADKQDTQSAQESKAQEEKEMLPANGMPVAKGS